jgi:hypothetical protein
MWIPIQNQPMTIRELLFNLFKDKIFGCISNYYNRLFIKPILKKFAIGLI